MFHVMFQVKPSASGYQAYLATAARLRPQLDTIDGFLSVERFRSTDRAGWILSLSKWADEAALAQWRATPDHRAAQRAGRDGVFDDYRLRVAQVAARGLPQAAEWQRASEPACGGPGRVKRLVCVLEVAGIARDALPSAAGASDSEWHESLADPGKSAWVTAWPDEDAAHRWYRDTHAMLDAVLDAASGAKYELSLTELERDYGLFPREEAPQYYPPAVRPAAS